MTLIKLYCLFDLFIEQTNSRIDSIQMTKKSSTPTRKINT